jgi:hypothetical protein
MGAIYSTPTTERLSRKLAQAGQPYWVVAAANDAWGKYLLFLVGGKCVRGCGWTAREADQTVRSIIAGEEGGE